MVNNVPPGSGSAAGAANGEDAAAGAAALGAPKVKPPVLPFCAGSPALVAAGEAGWLPVNVKDEVVAVGVVPAPKANPVLPVGWPNGDAGAAFEPKELLWEI